MKIFLSLVVAALALAAWWTWPQHVAPWLVSQVNGSNAPATLTELGQSGDLFGSLNTLFAACTVLGLLYGVHLQTKTLEKVEEQSFLPLFMAMLDQVKFPMTLRFPPNFPFAPMHGDDSSGTAMACLREWLEGTELSDKMIARKHPSIHEINALYEEFYSWNLEVLGPYFRAVYHLFAAIHHSKLPNSQKEHFANLARARLSANEVLLLAINSVGPTGSGLRPFIEYYGLLKHFRRGAPGSMPSADDWLVTTHYLKSASQSLEERRTFWRSNRRDRKRLLGSLTRQ